MSVARGKGRHIGKEGHTNVNEKNKVWADRTQWSKNHSQSTWRSTSTSLPRSVGAGATQETPPSSHSMSIRNERDFSLALSIRAAQADTRECPWYGVWAKVLQNYMFAGADASRTSCTCIPQYSLIASHDSGRSPPNGGSGRSDSDISMGSHSSDRHLMTPGGPLPGPPPVPYNPTPNFSPQSQAIFGGPLPPLTPSPVYPDFRRREPSPDSPTTQHVTRMQARRAVNVSNNPVSAYPLPQYSSSSSYPYPYPSDGTFPITPPRPTTTFSNASTRIPYFVQMLEHAQQPFPVIPSHVIRRVIMIVEIKPQSYAVPGGVFKWETIWKDQVQEQVLHAFEADRTLKYLGVLIAAGRRWVYSTVNRGKLVSRTMSEMRDPTWRGTGPQVPSSDNSVVEEGDVQPVLPSWNIPDFLPKAENGTLYQFDLLDARGDSLRAFQEIGILMVWAGGTVWYYREAE
ncbi:uncharacterized protein F5891DRAFT_983472 [Suillus fuscotomentosus]|uniref:Uncharacterized protein n=1 Tax=Suillus fuscotomentosus TaxID=1912939 RepID=A0AAD4DZE9_9AGAM|nr:uncharacterized protein F5891DRAFT_983472 [Suillus fuscotomentosus]KAG1896477.1 hypothetical protein F5891DRAFT_983472 [Suillus fuscotomentosus]